MKENFNCLALCYFSCIIPRSKLNLRENEKKSMYWFLSKVEIFKKNVILGPMFQSLSLIKYKSVS